MARDDKTFLEAALIGYQAEAQRIATAIADIQARLGGTMRGGSPARAHNVATPRKKHKISAEGRARIAAAQRKRWAAARKSKTAA